MSDLHSYRSSENAPGRDDGIVRLSRRYVALESNTTKVAIFFVAVTLLSALINPDRMEVAIAKMPVLVNIFFSVAFVSLVLLLIHRMLLRLMKVERYLPHEASTQTPISESPRLLLSFRYLAFLSVLLMIEAATLLGMAMFFQR